MRRLSIFTETPVIKNIIIINVIMFVLMFIYDNQFAYNNEFQNTLNYILGLHYFGSPDFRIWQIVTHFFMHASVSHIFFNMFSLFSLGVILEKVWGAKRFLIFYLICGLGAALMHELAQAFQVYQACQSFIYNPDTLTALQKVKLSGTISVAVGASGAIFGVFAAFALLFPNQELFIFFIPIPIKAKYVIGALVCIDFYLGFKGTSLFGYGDNIAHFAHIGGAITGFIMVQIWKRNRRTFW